MTGLRPVRFSMPRGTPFVTTRSAYYASRNVEDLTVCHSTGRRQIATQEVSECVYFCLAWSSSSLSSLSSRIGLLLIISIISRPDRTPLFPGDNSELPPRFVLSSFKSAPRPSPLATR